MNTSKMLAMVGLCGALSVAGFGGDVTAQGTLTLGGRRSNFGKKNLRPGFTPDPARVNVTSGGSIDAHGLNLGANCVGFVTQTPDYIVNLRGTSSNLRFYVTASGDTTLLINGADSAWHCNDDWNGQTNPLVDIPNAGAGQYDIWVGSYQANANIRAQLFITELSSNHP
jgi:hypothetical protein